MVFRRGRKTLSAVPASYAHYAGKVIGTSIGFDSVENSRAGPNAY